MKRGLILVLVFLFFISFLNTVEASISISQPKSIYNLGEILNTHIDIIGTEDGVIEVYLVCKQKQIFYAEYINLKENEAKKIDKIIKLKNDKGNCYIQAEINNETSKSQTFLISDRITTNITLNNETIIPKQILEIKGTAIKESGGPVTGVAYIFLDNLFLKNITIKNGIINEKLIIPNKLTSYESNFILNITDNENLNYGYYSKKIDTPPTPSFINIEMNNSLPGEKLIIKTTLYDQTGKRFDENISLSVFNSHNKKVYYNQINSGEIIELNLAEDASLGNWTIKSFYEEINTEKMFYVLANEKVNSTLNKNILNIKNIGNVPYKKTIAIELTSENDKFYKEFSLNLEIGDEQNLKLEAPNGEYSISLEGEYIGKVRLSGGEFSINEISNIYAAKNYIIIIGILIFLYLINLVSNGWLLKETRKIKNLFTKEVEHRKYVEKRLDMTEKERNKIKHLFEKYTDRSVANKIINTPNLTGEKKEVTALFIDIRGFSKISRDLGDEVIPILNEYFKIVTDVIYQNRGIVNHLEADEIFALFNAVSRQDNHEEAAVRSAIKIMQILEKRNQPGKVKINVGIGINSGMATIGQIGSDKIMKFTTIGNSINVAQKVEEKANNQIFITGKVYNRIKDKINAKKIGIMNLIDNPIEIYEVEY